MAGVARPVRMPPKSSLATETAFSIFSSASRSVSSIIGPLRTSQLLTRVPIFSPRTGRPMLPSSCSAKTMIGRALSMQRLKAVASATLRRRSSTSE
jgi:hypothetical protein